MRKFLVIVAVLGLVAASNGAAYGTVLVNEAAQPLRGYLADWGRKMRVYSVPRVVVHPNEDGCEWDSNACAGISEIWWVPGAWQRNDSAQFTLYHELGHSFDFAYMTEADHTRLTPWLNEDVGEHLTSWFTGQTWSDEAQNSLGEYFADAYANCAQYDLANEDPRVCRYVDMVGRRANANPPALRCSRFRRRWRRRTLALYHGQPVIWAP